MEPGVWSIEKELKFHLLAGVKLLALVYFALFFFDVLLGGREFWEWDWNWREKERKKESNIAGIKLLSFVLLFYFWLSIFYSLRVENSEFQYDA